MKDIKVVSIIDGEKLNKKLYTVRKCPLGEVREVCKNKHYLHRVPSIIEFYGLYKENLLLGIITFGIPPNRNLMKICGEKYKNAVLELNRLWCYDIAPRNAESYLIAQGIKLLKIDKPNIKILVSFADMREGHLGYIYQASNWYFTGYSMPGGGSILIDGEEHHAKSLNNKYGTSDINKLKEIFDTDNIFYRPRSKKCRYVYFIGNKRENKELRRLCKYPIYDKYPKELPIDPEYKSKQKVAENTQIRKVNLANER